MIKETTTHFELLNAAGRKVTVAFASDPDISISEEISSQATRKILALEIKGGGDYSNIWNRLGEAEKSHQSAKQCGFVEFWTIYNTTTLDLEKAREKSPTTNRFYQLSGLLDSQHPEYQEFRERLRSLLGLSAKTAATGG